MKIAIIFPTIYNKMSESDEKILEILNTQRNVLEDTESRFGYSYCHAHEYSMEEHTHNILLLEIEGNRK